MFIFVINCGSSSVKAKLFKANSHTNEICSAKVEAIGLPRCTLSFSSKEKSLTGPLNCKNHTEAIENILHGLQNHNVLNNLKEIILVGHRVVHGGENYTNPTIITKTVLKTIDSLSLLAPLHNPVNIKGIEAAQTFLPHATNIAVFDTAFHHTIPKEAFLYGLPLEFYEKQGIRKYGFHGISTKYVSEKARQLSPNLSELIVCHLGNGSSITAVKDGNSIETSMGYSPLDGIIMGSRSGELDPEVVLHILRQGTYTVDTLTELLNKKSGLFGISAVSTDIRDLKEAADNGNKRAELALNMLAHRIALFIGSYMPILHGLDAIAFTGGIGENAWFVREKVLKMLRYAGVRYDQEKNKENNLEISTPDSKVKLFIIPTNEELEIAKECLTLKTT